MVVNSLGIVSYDDKSIVPFFFMFHFFLLPYDSYHSTGNISLRYPEVHYAFRTCIHCFVVLLGESVSSVSTVSETPFYIDITDHQEIPINPT